MTASIHISLNQLKKLTQDLEKASTKVVTVGVRDLKNSSGTSTQEYANYLEFGWVQKVTGPQSRYLTSVSGKKIPPGATLMNPPRPFFRGTVDAEGDKWIKYLKNAVTHYSIENIVTAHQKALSLVGLIAQQDIQHTLANGGPNGSPFPQRAPLTMAIYEAKSRNHKKDGTPNTTSSTKAGHLTVTLINAIGFEIS